MNTADKFAALTESIKIYKELCNDIINKEDKQLFTLTCSDITDAVCEKYPTARKHIKNTDIEYLRYLAKYLMKISMLEKTNLEASISLDKDTLHLALNKNR